MILRRLTQHVREQNWFAVLLDFFIVVLGILIAFKITTWNEQQQAKVREQAHLNQLEIEFSQIKTQLVKQISIRETWVEQLGLLVSALENNSHQDDLVIRQALDSATATGRRPAQSAAYLQLMASGDLAILSNDELKRAIVDYHVRLERDSFMFPKLLDLVILELSTNDFRDFYVLRRTRGAAAIDSKDDQHSTAEDIASYDFEGLRTLINRYEAMYVLHISLITADEVQLDFANKILSLIDLESR